MKRPGPSLRIALAVIGLGVILVVPSAVIGIVRTVRTLSAPSFAIPAVVTRHLGTGTWIVYQQTGTTTIGELGVRQVDTPPLDPSQVMVTGSDDTQLTVGFDQDDETISRTPDVYTGELEFQVATSGVYTITFTPPGAERAIITRSFQTTAESIALEFIIGGIGFLLVLIGVTLLIVGGVRRGRANRAAVPAWSAGGAWPGAAPGSPPPGWYGDPSQAGRQRWWDGARWTEHQA